MPEHTNTHAILNLADHHNIIILIIVNSKKINHSSYIVKKGAP